MIERFIEKILFAARWLMAPFYLGLIVALAVLFAEFAAILIAYVSSAATVFSGGSAFGEEEAILGALSLIDLALMGSLILIVVYSGYENFVSRIRSGEHEDWPDWMTKVDFAQLKQKLLASIVLISGVQVLKAFMSVEKTTDRDLMWLVGIHLTLVVSAIAFSVSDWLQSRGDKSE
ncbi:MAG: TIGR00645 family protein [Parvularculaceae bacterium]|nr:TIGR00645 family protein [Parvularculaceae bacterium]